MRCQKVRSFLSAYCKQELSESRQNAVLRHLEVCPECRKEEIFCREIEGSIVKLPEHKVSEDFNSLLLKRVAEERFKETRTKAYHPKNVPMFGWSKIIPVATTVCLVLAFVFTGGLNILTVKEEPAFMANNDLDNTYETVQPVNNPNMQRTVTPAATLAANQSSSNAYVQHVNSTWTFKRELARATRIKNLLNQMAGQNQFGPQPSNLASILTNPEGHSIVMRLPFGRQQMNGFIPTTNANAAGR